jgi:hypothetical protein
MIIQNVSVISAQSFFFTDENGKQIDGVSLWYLDTTKPFPIKENLQPQKISVMDSELRAKVSLIKEFPTVIELHQVPNGNKLRLESIEFK